MNEVAIRQSNKMAEAAKMHDMPFAIRQINNGALVEQNGVYCIYGIDQTDVDNVSRLDEEALFKFCKKQEADFTIAYPHCTVTKITDTNNLQTAAMILDNFIVFDFLRQKAKDFGLKINARMVSNRNLSDLEVAYDESLNEKRPLSERKVFYDLVKTYLELYHENVKEEEFFKRHPEYAPKTNLVHETKTKNWVSDREYSCSESQLHRPSRMISSTTIEEKYLPELEDLLNKEEVYYHIAEKGVVCNDFGETDLPDDNFYDLMERKPRIMHTVAFDSRYEGLINGFKRTKENEYLRKHAVNLRYDSTFKYQAFSIPELWINHITDELARSDRDIVDKRNDEIIFDVKGTYVPSTYSTFGIVTTTQSGAEKVINALKHAMDAHMKMKIVNHDLEKQQLGDCAKITDMSSNKKQNKLPFTNNKNRDDDAR